MCLTWKTYRFYSTNTNQTCTRDSDYSWILDHNKKDKDAIQAMMNDEKDPKKDHDKLDTQALKEIDGVNMDSDVIVSEYRILYLKYEQLIETYKDAIANLSLK